MNYTELLNTYIKKSGLTLSEVCQRLEKKGISIDRSYLSKLKTGAKTSASGELSRAIAEVTGGDPEALVIAGYIEKSPEELKNTIAELNDIIRDFIDIIQSNSTPSQKFELLTDIKIEITDNPYIQGVLDNLMLEDVENIDCEDRLSIIAIYAIETFNFRDKLRIMMIVNLFYIRMMQGNSSNGKSSQIVEHSKEKPTFKTSTYFASLNNRKEILSEDEAEFLEDCLMAYRKQRKKAK